MALPINKIICGDSLQILKGFPENSIDCIITDPPYGVNTNYGKYYNDSFENWKTLMNNFFPLAQRISKCTLISTSKLEGEEFLFKYYVPLWRICWYKGACCTRSPIGFKDWETIFVYGSTKKQVHDFFMVQAASVRKEIIGHPCPKPEGWAKWLIEHFSYEDDIILDPFAGSGTTCVVAEKMNRKWIGIEINSEYCEIAKNRIINVPTHLEKFM